MRTETSEPRGEEIRKDQSIWKHIGCNGKIPTCVQGRVTSNRGEPLEVFGNKHPRYMAASVAGNRNEDRIRLIVQKNM